ncbi:MAG: hypothetical protein C5B59_08580 [Bacteroidetes bacterium]|nr:MAG: hypothetical protein C5B59_08580 [Bacteroidota bacterium]
MLRQDDYCKAKLVEMGWRWSKTYAGGHMAGQLVMHAIMNRVRCGWGTCLVVIDTIPKFMAENELPPLEHPAIWEPSFMKMLQAVDGIYDGSVPDMTNGALYWGELSHIGRDWFKAMIVAENPATGLRQHPQVANLNGLTFFA